VHLAAAREDTDPEATPVVLPNAPRNFRFSGSYAGCSAERAA
jgi:hypothetical protein